MPPPPTIRNCPRRSAGRRSCRGLLPLVVLLALALAGLDPQVAAAQPPSPSHDAAPTAASDAPGERAGKAGRRPKKTKKKPAAVKRGAGKRGDTSAPAGGPLTGEAPAERAVDQPRVSLAGALAASLAALLRPIAPPRGRATGKPRPAAQQQQQPGGAAR